jgi:tripartite-type tricarboxylate transporter receptor subunit TctC
VTDKINQALREALADPGIRQRMADLSSDIPSAESTHRQGSKSHLEAEIAKWGPVIQKAGIYAD